MSNYFFDRQFDKKRIKKLLIWFYRTYGESNTLKFVESLKKAGFQYSTNSGFSIGIEDLQLNLNKPDQFSMSEKQIQEIELNFENATLTKFEKLQQRLLIWINTNELLKEKVIKNFQISKKLNPLFFMSFSGARGNLAQVRQLVGMRGLMSDPNGEILEFPIRSNFHEGLTLTEYIISCYGARKGIVDTALRTATSGYLTRRLVDVAQHVIIEQIDCQSTSVLWLSALKNQETETILIKLKDRIVGRTIGKPIVFKKQKLQFDANTQVTNAIASKLANKLHRIPVRSPLTCQVADSVCQFCYGWNLAAEHLVSLGEAVGVIAAQAIGEPGTQLTMRTFHTGGVFSSDRVEHIYAPFSGQIRFLTPMVGHIVRTGFGKIGFLNQQTGLLKIINSQFEKFLSIPAQSVVYVKQGEYVYQYQYIAQFSVLNTLPSQGQKVYVEQDLCASHDGQIIFENMTLLEKRHKQKITRQYTQHIGTMWILQLSCYNWTLPGQKGIKNFDLFDVNVPFNKFIIQNRYFESSTINPPPAFGRLQTKNRNLPSKIQILQPFRLFCYHRLHFKNKHYCFTIGTPTSLARPSCFPVHTFVLIGGFQTCQLYDSITLQKIRIPWISKMPSRYLQKYRHLNFCRYIYKISVLKIQKFTQIYSYWPSDVPVNRKWWATRTQTQLYGFQNQFRILHTPISSKIDPSKRLNTKKNTSTRVSPIFQPKATSYLGQYARLRHQTQLTNPNTQKWLWFLISSRKRQKIQFPFCGARLPIWITPLWHPLFGTKQPSPRIYHYWKNRQRVLTHTKKILQNPTNPNFIKHTVLVYLYRLTGMTKKPKLQFVHTPESTVLSHSIATLTRQYFLKTHRSNLIEAKNSLCFTPYLHYQRNTRVYKFIHQIHQSMTLCKNPFWQKYRNGARSSLYLIQSCQDLLPQFYGPQTQKRQFNIKAIQNTSGIYCIQIQYYLPIQTGQYLNSKIRHNASQLHLLTAEMCISILNPSLVYPLGKLIRRNSIPNFQLPESGRLIAITSQYWHLQKADPKLLTSNGILHVNHQDFICQNTRFFTLFFNYLKTNDIVQGIPKIEEFFEARSQLSTNIGASNLQNKLNFLYQKYRYQFKQPIAVRRSITKLQQFLIQEIQTIYTTQGIMIADKHIEIIIKQMTTKVRITEGGSSGLLAGEFVELNWIEKLNAKSKLNCIHYEPILLGITQTCLETNSFISAASFQETIRILTQSAIKNKMDFLCGLKENVILGHLIPAGTGLINF